MRVPKDDRDAEIRRRLELAARYRAESVKHAEKLAREASLEALLAVVCLVGAMVLLSVAFVLVTR